MEWQPISTAPKDGTLLLVYGEYVPCNDGDKSFRILRRAIVSWSKLDEEWAVFGGDWLGPWIINATHWMPMPAPPAAVQAVIEGDEG